MNSIALRGLMAAGFVSVLAAGASADWRIGGSRANLMGGAGLALPVNVQENMRLNPALRAFNSHFALDFPAFGVELEGVTLSELRDNLSGINKGGVADDKLLDFGKRLGSRDTRFGINGDLGILMNGFSIGAYGQATVIANPNAPLRQWVSGGAAGDPPPGAQLDAYGLGFYELDFGYGKSIPVKEGDLALGGVLKFVRGYYSHEIAQYNSNNQSVDGTVNPGLEMGGSDAISKSGVGFDFGSIYSPASTPGLHLGLVVENFIEPNVKFDRQLPDSATILGNDVAPFRRAINLGAGYELRDGKTLAAVDLIDVGNKAGRGALALGVQHYFSNQFGAGIGYNSKTKFTIGVTVFGINFAYANEHPQVGYTFRF